MRRPLEAQANHSRLKSHHGFTIVELLIVIVIIGILATITIVAYSGITTKANLAAATSNAQQIGQKLAIYYTSNGSMPADLATAGITDTTNLQYTSNLAVNGFCLTSTQGSASVNVGGLDGSVNTPINGPCISHTAPAGTIPGANNSNKLSNGKTCPASYVVVPGNSTYGTNDFCAMKYEAKNVGGVATSQAAGTPWISISQTNAITTSAATCAGCHMMTEPEWMTIAANVLSVPSNWSSNVVGSGYIYSGHNDNAPANSLAADTNDTNGYAGETNAGGSQKRTLKLTNGQVIWDLAGNVNEWINKTLTGNQPGVSGFNWSQYTSITDFKGLSSISRPASITLSGQNVTTWNSTQGIGQIYSNGDESSIRSFLRGGAWSTSQDAGVLCLNLSGTPTGTYTSIGFRVVSPGV